MNLQGTASSHSIDRASQTIANGICLHIGCGLHAPEQWRNVDASPSLKISKIPLLGSYLSASGKIPKWSKTVSYGDIVKGLRYEENSCDAIFAAHVLEHLSLSDFDVALKNIYSYLKPNGVLRFIVPDLKQYVDTYVKQSSDSAFSSTAAYEFMENSWLGQKGSRKNLYYRLREAMANSRHQWMWDESSLLHTLSTCGFQHIRRCEYGDWSDPRFSFVESAQNYFYALGIEAIK